MTQKPIMNLAIEYLCNQDVVFQNIINQYGVPTIPKRPQGFETLVLLILEQQVSIDSAKATFNKLKNTFENFIPEILIEIQDENYRNHGVSRQKTKYIKCLSQAILEKSIDLESFSTKSSDEVRQELIKIKGIGNWTIDVYLMFALQEPDIIPLGDIAVKNTITELYSYYSIEEMTLLSNNWKPYRSYATFILWHYYLKKRNKI